MLFKWIMMAILAWYIFRAAGNLIAAAKGQVPPAQGRHSSRRGFDDFQTKRQDDSSEPSIRVVKKRSADSEGRAAPPSSDVEDARFTDL
jgi:hypothetical protein